MQTWKQQRTVLEALTMAEYEAKQRWQVCKRKLAEGFNTQFWRNAANKRFDQYMTAKRAIKIVTAS